MAFVTRRQYMKKIKTIIPPWKTLFGSYYVSQGCQRRIELKGEMEMARVKAHSNHLHA